MSRDCLYLFHLSPRLPPRYARRLQRRGDARFRLWERRVVVLRALSDQSEDFLRFGDAAQGEAAQRLQPSGAIESRSDELSGDEDFAAECVAQFFDPGDLVNR